MEPYRWVELLKRLGMTHKWHELERAVLGLARQPQRPGVPVTRRDRVLHARFMQSVFTKNMRKAIFVWGFQSASVRNQLRPPPVPLPTDQVPLASSNSRQQERWAQGIALLRRLQCAGFKFPTSHIRIVFVQRMMVLFGPAYSVRRVNQEARRNNRLSLAHYIRHANKIWPELVNWVHPRLLQADSDPGLLPAFFGPVFLASKRKRQYVDVVMWSRALGKGRSHFVEPRHNRLREAAWMRSNLRVDANELDKLLENDAFTDHTEPTSLPATNVGAAS